MKYLVSVVDENLLKKKISRDRYIKGIGFCPCVASTCIPFNHPWYSLNKNALVIYKDTLFTYLLFLHVCVRTNLTIRTHGVIG